MRLLKEGWCRTCCLCNTYMARQVTSVWLVVQVLRYDKGADYRERVDWFDNPMLAEQYLRNNDLTGGSRVVSVHMFLTGGATRHQAVQRVHVACLTGMLAGRTCHAAFLYLGCDAWQIGVQSYPSKEPVHKQNLKPQALGHTLHN